MFLDRFFNTVAGDLDQWLILPVLYHFGWMEWEELSFDWALVCVYGMFAVLMTYAVCWPLEALFPIEHWPNRKAAAVDVPRRWVMRRRLLPPAWLIVSWRSEHSRRGSSRGLGGERVRRWRPVMMPSLSRTA